MIGKNPFAFKSGKLKVGLIGKIVEIMIDSFYSSVNPDVGSTV